VGEEEEFKDKKVGLGSAGSLGVPLQGKLVADL
jgi:hypothetical protein